METPTKPGAMTWPEGAAATLACTVSGPSARATAGPTNGIAWTITANRASRQFGHDTPAILAYARPGRSSTYRAVEALPVSADDDEGENAQEAAGTALTDLVIITGFSGAG